MISVERVIIIMLVLLPLSHWYSEKISDGSSELVYKFCEIQNEEEGQVSYEAVFKEEEMVRASESFSTSTSITSIFYNVKEDKTIRCCIEQGNQVWDNTSEDWKRDMNGLPEYTFTVAIIPDLSVDHSELLKQYPIFREYDLRKRFDALVLEFQGKKVVP